MLAALLPCRREFYRKASLVGERFTSVWAGLIAVVLLCAVWLGIFSYKHVEYNHQLWWRFAAEGDAPRFLRATTGAVVVVLLFALLRLLVPAKSGFGVPGPDELGKAEAIVRKSRKTYAYLALLGDKKFVFGEQRDAFIMYAVQGGSWIAMGDPVGPEDRAQDVIWRYRELCDRCGGWPVFYEVGGENLGLYLDVGMTFFKLGEEARVPLRTFSLEGSSRRNLRHAHNKAAKEGCSFEVAAVSNVPAIIGELENISNAWLREKITREKGFSLGFFAKQYISRFPIAVVRRGSRIIAFANIWEGAGKDELSIDLMRYLPDSPEGIMDYLFVELLLWGGRQGYEWFNLGMAPLSGLDDRAPFWAQAGDFVFQHGEHFYNFRGLRQYKEKFEPQWEPKYLACAKSLMLPRILANLAALVSGGLKGTIAK
jgi:phosphatidylglycerol lysyltransferase